MKKWIFPLITLFAAGWIIISGNASGAAQSQGTDRTGSPLGNSFCGDCHGSGSYNPTLALALLDGNTPVTQYTPGKTYTLQVSITAGAGTPVGYGYQATVLNGTNGRAGTFGAAPSGQRVVTLGGVQYAEQSRRSSSNTFQIPWTAPATGTGRLNVYASGLAVNGDGSTGRDNAIRGSLTLSEAGTTTLSEARRLDAQVDVFPNPVVDVARIAIRGLKANAPIWLELLDQQGRSLQQQSLRATGQILQAEVDVHTYPRGHYWLRISDQHRVKTVALIK